MTDIPKAPTDARMQSPEHQHITASDLKSFYYFSCWLELWKSVHEGHIPENRGDASTLSMAHINRGHKWESLLVKQLDQKKLILRFSSGVPLRLQIEDDPRDHFYIINSAFKDRNLFQKEFTARGANSVAFGTLKPDFIEVWKRVENGKKVIEYHIIDAKASKSVQVVLFLHNVLIIDLSSSASILLLACFARTPSFGIFYCVINSIDMVAQRGKPTTILTIDFKTADGLLPIFDDSTCPQTSSYRSPLALQFYMPILQMGEFLSATHRTRRDDFYDSRLDHRRRRISARGN